MKDMKKSLILIIKGFILGIANVIPGVSGGTIALTMGIYEELIDAISHFFTNFKKNMKLLLPLAIGLVISILLMSKLITFCLDKYPFPTILFFVGLVLGGLPLLFKKVQGKKVKPLYIFLFIITFAFVLVLNFMFNKHTNINLNNLNFGMMLILFIVGAIASASMVMPGISGSFVLMLLGFYKPVWGTVSKLTDFSLLGHNLAILIPFGLGVLLGIFLISKLLEFLFKKYELPTYYAILGFIIASIIVLLIGLIGIKITIIQALIAAVLVAAGLFIGYKLGDE
jgi:putative membrane protein